MATSRRADRRQAVLEALREHLAGPEGRPFVLGEGIHPADVADAMWLDLEPDEARRLFRELPLEQAAEVLGEAEEGLYDILLPELSPDHLGDLLSLLPADDGADILERLPPEVQRQVLARLEPEDASELRHLRTYEADTAGGMMTTEFVALKPDEKVGDVIKRLRRDEDDAETIHALYVVDDQGRLEGVLSTRELLEAGIHDTIGEIMNPDVISVRVDEDQEEVAHRILHYNLHAIPVVDARGVLVGVVTADDALEVLEEEGSEDALLLAGASAAASAGESLWKQVVHRAPTMLVTLAGGTAISWVMRAFGLDEAGSSTSTLSQGAAAVVPYVPMTLGLAGNVGSQTSAILVRGFAVGQIPPGRRRQVFWDQVRVGAALGLLMGVLITPVIAWTSTWEIGLSVGVSLVLAMTWTATAASAIAMGSQAAGLDPAVVAGPVMMAVSDLSATLLFFGTASFLMGS